MSFGSAAVPASIFTPSDTDVFGLGFGNATRTCQACGEVVSSSATVPHRCSMVGGSGGSGMRR
jgi:hypothetical protein